MLYLRSENIFIVLYLRSENIFQKQKEIVKQPPNGFALGVFAILYNRLQMLTSILIIIPDKSFPFAKDKKSENLMKFPEFLFLGFLNRSFVLIGFDIIAAKTKTSVLASWDTHMKSARNITDGPLIVHLLKNSVQKK